MKSIFKRNAFIAILIIPFGGFSIDAFADDNFPLPHNYTGYGSTCTIGPKQTVLCDSGSNGNQYYWFTMSPISKKTGYFPNGPGFFTNPVPRMIFAAESLADATKIRVTSFLTNGLGGRWQSSTALLDSNGRADLPQGINKNYRYNIEIFNDSLRTVRVQYHVCATFYGAGGPANGEYCGTLPASRFTPPIKPIMCGTNDGYGIVLGISPREEDPARGARANFAQYSSNWDPRKESFVIPDDGGRVSAIACTKYSANTDATPYAFAGTDTGNLYYINSRPNAVWFPMHRPKNNNYPITAMTACSSCKFAYAGDSDGYVYMFDTERRGGMSTPWTLFGGGKIPSRITALTIGSSDTTNAVYAGGTGGRVWISGNDAGGYWTDLAPLPTDHNVVALASSIGSPYIYAADNNNTWKAGVNVGAGVNWVSIQVPRAGAITSTITTMYVTSNGSSANRYVYMGDSVGQTWVHANTDDNGPWTQLPSINGGSVTSFTQDSDSEIQVLLSNGNRYKRKLTDNNSAWEFMDALPS